MIVVPVKEGENIEKSAEEIQKKVWKKLAQLRNWDADNSSINRLWLKDLRKNVLFTFNNFSK